MSKVAIVTDSNSGITQGQAEEYGVYVLPMPFFINGKLYFEDINLTQKEFYEKLTGGAEISTSTPAVGDVTELWDRLLKSYDEIVHIPMSSGLSSSCQTAMMLAQDYEGRVHVANNQRISVTQRQSVLDAKVLADHGKKGEFIKTYLEETKYDSSIYIMVETLKYLKKGKVWPHIYTLFFVVLGWGIFTANQPGAPLGLLLQKLFVPQGGISPVYYLRNYGVLLVLGCVCSSALPHWLWEKISKNTVAKLLVFALLTALCVCYVVAATNATALYANF